MTEKTYAKAFGLISTKEKDSLHDFKGDIVYLESVENKIASFFFKGQTYQAPLRQLEPLKFLFPPVLYVKEPSLEDSESVIVEPTEISNCYARRGSHWIRYFIDPESLSILNEEEESVAAEQARKAAPLVITKKDLFDTLKQQLPQLSDDEILKIVDQF